MMEGDNQVNVHGMWASTYSKRVELALKLKGIHYEYVEEDLGNKSEALLKYNSAHKKVPVLVHNGKPLAESLVILEYIDEAWPNHFPRLLPEEPYQRAMVRFWASFLHNQLAQSLLKLFQCNGEAQDKALDELHEKMTLMEHRMTDFIPKDVSCIDKASLGLLDIQLISLFGAYKAREEVIGKKILDPEKHPLIFSWVTSLMNLPVVQESIPDHKKLVALIQMFIKAS
ncbi:hypothetical protein BVRB_5g114920 [Beta vulgaris subsp. vulgaris]|uniref:glutathione S-transferase U10 n=1 Tax=Beta vulgaris subsp. vulgaris TaxID=3555 RepID=UPI00053F6022|nr:glutathione S-transferase U10 [Beta vulgaris subsp. vulgaris]KMT10839.1 hypothetical protein BVRB_5g114920 [Beta vulgaris subsp. vulgaris]